MSTILVTPRSFGKYNKEEMEKLLADQGISVRYNPYGRILTKEEMIKEIADVDGLILGVDPVDADVFEAAKNLITIAKYGVGLDNIDLDEAKNRKIKVSITKNANSNAVADYSFALLLAVARNLVPINNNAKAGDWKKQTSLDVYGKKIGILGLGAIGRGVVARAKGFGMDVYGFDLFKDEDYITKQNITFTDVDTIIKECDFISLHLPLTDDTKYLLNKENLAFVKENLILVNTARGGLVDEAVLYDLLKSKKIYGAGIDAFETEPPQDSPLLTLDNVIVGSHTAAGSQDATNMMTSMAVSNIIADMEENENE